MLWSGLKGAVPILLGTFVLSEGVDHASRIYNIIFIAVTVSVVVQGGLVPHCRQAAARADEGRGTRTVGTGLAFPRRARGGPLLSCRPRIARRWLNDRRSRRRRHGVGQHPQPRRPLHHVNGQTAPQAGDEVLALADKMPNWTVCSPAQAAGE